MTNCKVPACRKLCQAASRLGICINRTATLPGQMQSHPFYRWGVA